MEIEQALKLAKVVYEDSELTVLEEVQKIMKLMHRDANTVKDFFESKRVPLEDRYDILKLRCEMILSSINNIIDYEDDSLLKRKVWTEKYLSNITEFIIEISENINNVAKLICFSPHDIERFKTAIKYLKNLLVNIEKVAAIFKFEITDKEFISGKIDEDFKEISNSDIIDKSVKHVVVYARVKKSMANKIMKSGFVNQPNEELIRFTQEHKGDPLMNKVSYSMVNEIFDKKSPVGINKKDAIIAYPSPRIHTQSDEVILGMYVNPKEVIVLNFSYVERAVLATNEQVESFYETLNELFDSNSFKSIDKYKLELAIKLGILKKRNHVKDYFNSLGIYIKKHDEGTIYKYLQEKEGIILENLENFANAYWKYIRLDKYTMNTFVEPEVLIMKNAIIDRIHVLGTKVQLSGV